MDAHDIYKQLTKGVKFVRKKNLSSGQNAISNVQKDQYIEIKTEKTVHADSKDEETSNLIEGDSMTILQDFPLVAKNKKKKEKTKRKLKLLETEELRNFRKTHRISVSGKNIPVPIHTFEELETKFNVPVQLINNLAQCGYPLPTPIQMQSIPIMLEGRSLMACAPTGSGKTVAFLLPIIRDLKEPQKKGFRALVLCPTRELAKQTLRECIRLTEKTGLKSYIINKSNLQKFGSESSKKYDILVSTPNRICYLLNQTPPILDLKNIEWFVVDEADKLMEEGAKGFKEQFDTILGACTNENRKVALFSATYTVPVAKWALRYVKKCIQITIGERNSATDLVEQELLFVGSESGKLLAIRSLVQKGLQPPVLVFVQSKDRARQLFGELIYDGINVDVIHADRTQQQRDNVVKAFREGKIWVLICTELMGRGIDFKGVNLVINYDFPPTSISYIHRIGRTGRAARRGKAITFFTQDDTPNLRSIANIIKNSGGTVPDFMLTLKKTTKSEKKKFANSAPNRDDIRTLPKFELERKNRLKDVEKTVKKLHQANEKRKKTDGKNNFKRDVNNVKKQKSFKKKLKIKEKCS